MTPGDENTQHGQASAALPQHDDLPASVYLDRGPDAEAHRYRALRRLLGSEDSDVLADALDRVQEAIEVYRAAPVELAPALCALLNHSDASLCRRAADLLSASAAGAAASREQLASLLRHEDAVLVDTAARGLALVGDESVLPVVISALGDDARGAPRWIGDALRALPHQADLLLPVARSALYRHVSECTSESYCGRSYRWVLEGIADWPASRALIRELAERGSAGCVVTKVAAGLGLRSDPEPIHLAAVFECTMGSYYRNRIRQRRHEMRAEHGFAALEASVDQALAAGPTEARRRSVLVDLVVLAATGEMRPEHERLLEVFASCDVYAPHAAYGLWLAHRGSAAKRACSMLAPYAADPYIGPTVLGYLAEMGADATGALDVIDGVLARRRRITVNDPDWSYELRSDERLCAAAQAARQAIRPCTRSA